MKNGGNIQSPVSPEAAPGAQCAPPDPKAQVSTEYLVILAVVMVVALKVISLVGGFSSFGTASSQTQQNSYWASLSPISVSVAQSQSYYLWYHGCGLGYPCDQFDAVNLTVTNTGLYIIVISAVSATAAGTGFVWTGPTTLAPGQVVTLPVHTLGHDNSGTICVSGSTSTTFTNVSFTYTQQGLNGFVETGTAPLTTTCLSSH